MTQTSNKDTARPAEGAMAANVAEIDERLSIWHRDASRNQALHYVLGIVATVCPLVVATLKGNPTASLVAAVLGSAAAAVLSLADFRSVGNRTRDAWRRVTAARMQYRLDPQGRQQQYLRIFADA